MPFKFQQLQKLTLAHGFGLTKKVNDRRLNLLLLLTF